MIDKKEIDLKEIKLLGGIGFVCIYVMPIVGLVLILVALKKLADATEKPNIFRDFLTASVIAVVWFFLIFLYLVICPHLFSNGGSGELTPDVGLLLFVGGLFLTWIFATVSAHYMSKSLFTVAEVTKEQLLAQAARLISFGALLTIVLIGPIVIFVGIIYAIVAFFSLPDKVVIEEVGQT
ncbi:DUF996 domain-containing protein [bacterium]|nr:DUF996 domain-containing protein [bacterium]